MPVVAVTVTAGVGELLPDELAAELVTDDLLDLMAPVRGGAQGRAARDLEVVEPPATLGVVQPLGKRGVDLGRDGVLKGRLERMLARASPGEIVYLEPA